MKLYPAAMRMNLNQHLRALLALEFEITGYREIYVSSFQAKVGQHFPFLSYGNATGGLRPQWGQFYSDRIYGELSYIAGKAPGIMEDFWKEARAYTVYFGVEKGPLD